MSYPAIAALVAFVFFVAIALFAGRRAVVVSVKDPARLDRYFLAAVVISGFAVRTVVAVAIHRAGLQHSIAPDEQTFSTNGLLFSQWLSGKSLLRLSPRYLGSLQVGYFYLVGGLYYLFGPYRLIPILIDCAAGSLAALPVFRIARELSGRRAGRTAAVLATFFPSVLLWSTLLVRDSLVILVLLLLIATVMDLRHRFSFWRVARYLLLLMALGTLRQYLFLLVAAATVATFVLGRAGRTKRSLAVGIVVFIGLVLVVRFAGFGTWSLERASFAQLNLHREYNSLDASPGALLPRVDISNPVSALAYLPVGMFYFLGSPFPWQVVSTRQMMALPDVLVWYLLLPFTVVGFVSLVRRRLRDSAMLLLTMGTILCLYSLVEANVGIIFRHRAQIIVPMMVLTGHGYAVVRERWRARKERPAAAAAQSWGAPWNAETP